MKSELQELHMDAACVYVRSELAVLYTELAEFPKAKRQAVGLVQV